MLGAGTLHTLETMAQSDARDIPSHNRLTTAQLLEATNSLHQPLEILNKQLRVFIETVFVS